MKKINEVKWRGLQSFDDILNNEVGPENSPERERSRHVRKLITMLNY